MNRTEFNKVVEDAIERSKKVLISKNDEYSNGTESFSNFKDGYKTSLANSPEAYAWDLATKHLQSIKDIISTIDEKLPSDFMICEKFTDAHNYLYLIEGMISERKTNN